MPSQKATTGYSVSDIQSQKQSQKRSQQLNFMDGNNENRPSNQSLSIHLSQQQPSWDSDSLKSLSNNGSMKALPENHLAQRFETGGEVMDFKIKNQAPHHQILGSEQPFGEIAEVKNRPSNTIDSTDYEKAMSFVRASDEFIIDNKSFQGKQKY